MNKLIAMTAGLLATTALVAAPAMAADNTDLSKQVQALQQQLRTIQQQLDATKANDAAVREAIAKETAAHEEAEKAAREAAMEAGATSVFSGGKQKIIPPQNPKVVQSGTNRFSMSSADNAWSIAPTGRMHFDFGGYLNQKPQGTTGPGTVAGGKLTGGVNVRRARLGVVGVALEGEKRPRRWRDDASPHDLRNDLHGRRRAGGPCVVGYRVGGGGWLGAPGVGDPRTAADAGAGGHRDRTGRVGRRRRSVVRHGTGGAGLHAVGLP